MTMTLEQALMAALDDEYHGRATYRAVLDAYGDVRPFVNIVGSEVRHIQALRRLFERYGVAIPQDPWPPRVSAPASLEAACEAALEAERENAVLYEQLIGGGRGARGRRGDTPAPSRGLPREPSARLRTGARAGTARRRRAAG